ncbi:MAG: PASTA domain-containing protein [Muribaculaceae bacterium]|nr:PASTA domain-containing protein [Muribaculaceae bacterium]
MKKILMHIGLMVLVGLAVAWMAMLWLDKWTRHGDTIVVPSVKTYSFERATQALKEDGLLAILSDSVYDNRTAPGTVIEQNPKAGTVVKEGREIYLTINAFSPKMVTLPSLTDISVRQAKSILEGLEIKKVIEKRVPSDFKDLVLAVRYNGSRLSPGARVPVSATIELEVGEGLPDVLETDSIPAEESVPTEQLDLFN